MARIIKPVKTREIPETIRALNSGPHAVIESGVTWVSLKNTLALAERVYLDAVPAKQTLYQGFRDRRVRMRAASLQGRWREDAPTPRLSWLWRRENFWDGASAFLEPHPSRLRVDWEKSSATLRGEGPGEAVTFYRLEAAREDVLRLLPEGYKLPAEVALLNSQPATELGSTGFKRGRKEYSDEELEPFKIRFYLMLFENDVSAKGTIVVENYAQDLIDWGGRAKLEKDSQADQDDRKNWEVVSALVQHDGL